MSNNQNQAATGMSIDKPEFRKLLRAYAHDDNLEVGENEVIRFIDAHTADLRAQLARAEVTVKVLQNTIAAALDQDPAPPRATPPAPAQAAVPVVADYDLLYLLEYIPVGAARDEAKRRLTTPAPAQQAGAAAGAAALICEEVERDSIGEREKQTARECARRIRATPTATAADTTASDGAIYEAVSRRADPEGHAEAMAQMDEVLARATLAPVAAQQTNFELLEALKDARFSLYGNGPGNPKIDAAIAKAENEVAAQQADEKSVAVLKGEVQFYKTLWQQARAREDKIVPQQAAAVNIGGCPFCGRSNECASDCAAKAPAAQAVDSVGERALDAELNKRFPLAGAESAPDAVRMRVAFDRAIFKLGWRAALASPASTPEASRQAAAEFTYQYRKKCGEWKTLHVASDEEAATWAATEPGAEWRKVTDIGNDRQAAAVAAPSDVIEQRTEKIRIAHANPTERSRTHLIRDVAHLLAHIALLRPTAAAATTGEDARANTILRELVELRDLKADYDKVPHMHHVYWMRDKLADYETRWPAAWEKATAYARNAAMDDAMRATQQEGE